MKIEFSKKEFSELLNVLALSDWVINSCKSNEEERCDWFDKLEQKLFVLAKEAGCEDLIEYDTELKSYVPTEIFENASPTNDLIDEYDEYTFWEGLSDRLAMRDIIRKYGEAKVANMKPEEQIGLLTIETDKYDKELSNNGVKNLVLK